MTSSTKSHSSRHCLIFDPVPFYGGSKVASYEMVRQSLKSEVNFTVLTCDPNSWRAAWPESMPFNMVTFHKPGGLSKATSGWQYWLKHLYFMLMICLCLLKHRSVTTLIGISGPGVDMALYGCGKLLRYRLIQFIHGPVPCSGSVGYCLTQADRVFYLPSTLDSIRRSVSHYFNRWLPDNSGEALADYLLATKQYQPFINGIGRSQWPTASHYSGAGLLWAASLLKWKGLDILVDALRLLPDEHPLRCDICFIRPHNINLPHSKAPVTLPGVSWHEQPQDLDSIRANSSIFVSTSQQEPFGLSILEALAAGLCVVIPQDGSYWDQKLRHNVNCIKYTPNCPIALAQTLKYLISDRVCLRQIGQAGQLYAENYRAEICYLPIVQYLSSCTEQSVPLKTGQYYA